MEKGDPGYHTCSKQMNDGMVIAFESMVLRKQYKEALNFIRYSVHVIPTPGMVNDILFKILVDCDDIIVVNQARVYLTNVLKMLPVNMTHTYFLTALLDKSENFKDIWKSFSHFVESYLCYYKLLKGTTRKDVITIEFPNCDVLVRIYIEIFTKCLPSASYFLEDNSNDKISELLGWINEFYKKFLKKIILLNHLHKLLDCIVKDKVMKMESMPLPKVLNQPSVHKFAKTILTKCPDAFRSPESQERFFSHCSLSYIQLKMAQRQLHKLLYTKIRPKDLFLTLKALVENYLFFNDGLMSEENLNLKKQPGVKSEESKNKHTDAKTKAKKKSDASEPKKKSDTELHKACKEGKYGDLIEILVTFPEIDVNQKNDAGNTPLHEACFSNSYLCVKVLAQDGKGVDFKAIDNEGRTPLHCAALVDAMDLAVLLMEFGGADIVNCLDNSNKRPIDYAKSGKMKELLKTDVDNPTIPYLKSQEEYRLYLQNLYTVFSLYFDLFGLYNVKEKDPWIQSHDPSDENKCPHYSSQSSDNAICSEDFATMEQLPEKLKAFFDCIKQKAEEMGIEMNNELLPLRSFTSTLEK